MHELELIQRATEHGDAIAFRSGGEPASYADLLTQSQAIAEALLGDGVDLAEARIAYLAPAGHVYASIQWGIWRAGGIAVPLSLAATPSELAYTLSDAQVSQVVATTATASQIESLCAQLNLRLLIAERLPEAASPSLPDVTPARRAMILYTSGTTSKP
ncbi:MAG: AMP-binding protein, partial [Verrucomicrobia bacterium]|nr:AMP-binding protein [Verrucomicrobiota bacterium]